MPPAAPIRWLVEHRRRLAPLVLLAGVLIVGSRVAKETSSEMALDFILAEGHPRATSARIAYIRDGSTERGVTMHFPRGVPNAVHHEVELAAGRWDVALEVLGDGTPKRMSGSFECPAEGRVRVILRETQAGEGAP